MARALLVALACAACATCTVAARYGDYAGARMPQYGGGDYDAREPRAPAHEPDDYRGHSPDAPAALDYKYEEDLSSSQIGKTEPPLPKEAEETDSWQQRPARKHKKSRAVDDIHTNPAERFDPDDDFPKARSSNSFRKHHSRHKNRKFEREDEDSPKYPVNYRGRNEDSDIEEELQLGTDFQNGKSKSFEDDRYAPRAGSERVVRRKPRDRQMKRKEFDSEEQVKSDSDRERWYLQGLGRAPAPGPLEPRPTKRIRPPEEPNEPPMRDSDADEDPMPRGGKSKGNPKSYDEYSSDYYDMKRVMNIKNKLPTLMRRTTVPEEKLKPSTLSIEDILSNRRIFLPPPPATRTSTEPPTTTKTTISTTPTVSSSPKSTTMNISKEMSLAEKSRLSILKKAQRKESLHLDQSTKKPPVLLQVTKKLPTMVMVEPPSSQQPWMRAQEVFADSPERLDKVKRLMRHKLVANAKSIHELTDNWDDLVCDYIDMSLLDAHSSAPLSRSNVVIMTIPFQLIIIFR